MTTTKSLQRLSDTIELLDNSSKQLMHVMEEQVDAIIASDTLKIESLTEAHTSLSWYYKKNEEQFILELTEIHNSVVEEGSQDVRLVNLKEYFPEWGAEIDKWHAVISENTVELQRKHNQVLELLEFAMHQNARLMHNMYTKHSEKNLQYKSTGERTDVATGVAVNQEV